LFDSLVDNYFSQWISNQPDSWTEEMVQVFGPAILLENDLTEDETVEDKRAEYGSGEEPPIKKRKGVKR
jgi:hypothetical protein